MKHNSLSMPSVIFLFVPTILLSSSDKPSIAKAEALKILKEVYAEVKDMGPYAGEDYIKREFFIGWDDDDTNKDEHVVVLIQAINGVMKMTIQVTYLERTRANPKIKNAVALKNVVCALGKDGFDIISSDYDDRGLKEMAAGLRKAVLDKRKLLRSALLTGRRVP